MSGTLPYYVKLFLVSTADLWVGVGLAKLVEYAFKDRYSLSEDPMERLKWNLIWCSAQAGTSVLVGEQVRNLLYPPDFDDPTGGVVFMNALFMPQPNLWKNAGDSLDIIASWLPNELKTGTGQVISTEPVPRMTRPVPSFPARPSNLISNHEE